MKFQLKKSKWLRGEGCDASRLLRPFDGKMCCMGQLAHRLRVPLRDLRDTSMLDELDTVGRLSKLAECDANACYFINDDTATTDAQKIRELRPILAKHGIELEVVE